MVSETVPTWQDRARERSLATARQRADDQLGRLLHAAQTMINEDVDLTIPALVARAGMSSKTFYRHFASRDDLLLAVFEEEQAIAAHLVQKAVDADAEPVARLRAAVMAYLGLPGRYRNTKVRQSRVQDGQRLRALYTERVYGASAAMRGIFRGVVEDLVAAGLTEVDDADFTARTLLHVLNTHIGDTAFDTSMDATQGTELVWRFCARALQLQAG